MGKYSKYSKHLPDIQEVKDTRNVEIDHVGVSGIKLPILLLEKEDGLAPRKIQRTVGTIGMYVHVPAERKGTHMSRFTELLNRHTENQKTFSNRDLIPLAIEMLDYLDTDSSNIRINMDYFMYVKSPVTLIRGVAPYEAYLEVSAERQEGTNGKKGKPTVKVVTGVTVVGQTCCPCSKEISDFDKKTKKGRGAHSQHGTIRIAVRNDPRKIIWFEDLIDIGNRSLSAPAFPILKRVDERAATIMAYENPCFVEDVVRNAVTALRKLDGVLHYTVTVQNDEVIHFHKAEAICSDWVMPEHR